MREAADATLDQTCASLTFSLAGFTGLLEFSGANSRASVVELARSLQTDRPNLTRMIKTAEKDARIAEILDSPADLQMLSCQGDRLDVPYAHPIASQREHCVRRDVGRSSIG